LKAEVSELQDVGMLKILSIYCVMRGYRWWNHAQNWLKSMKIGMCSLVKEMRIQAENISRVHSIYVVDDEDRLKGRLSLKDLLTTSSRTPINDVYIRKLNSVKVDTEDVEVARIMQKYDLEAIPVVDEWDD
jgi:Mg/Co/Ni transporter MgtE